MSRDKFDEKNLKDGVKLIANGVNTLNNVNGDDIRLRFVFSKIGTIMDADKSIEGAGKVIKEALWFYLCR